MAVRGTLAVALVVLAIPHATGAAPGCGPGEAAGKPRRGEPSQPIARNPDFKVVVWYRRADALGTFKYAIYDLRKGEYTAAVEAWIKDMAVKYSNYDVVVRDVDLRREKGQTEKLKVGSVIQRELMVAAAVSGVVLGGPPASDLGSRISTQSSAPRSSRQPGAIASDRSFLDAGPALFPVPLPYPRPHP